MTGRGTARLPWITNVAASSSVNCFYCGIALREAFGEAEIVGLLAAGVASAMVFMLAVHRREGWATVSMSVRGYAKRMIEAGLPLRHAVSTAALTMLALAAAVQLGLTREEYSLAIVEGIRTGALILVGLRAWRLDTAGRLLAVAAWIAADIWVYSSVVVPGIGSAWITFAAGVASGAVLLQAQDAIDRRMAELP